jgi:hypothetical protein
MTYKDLTIHQKIGLKGEIQNNPSLHQFKIAWLFFGFRKTIDYFLTNDINVFYE